MDHHQQLGQFSILRYHSTISRRPLECVLAASPAVNGTRATHIIQTARQSAGLAGKAKEQRRGACELSEGSGGPDNACKLGQQEGRRRRYGSPAVSMATAVLTQLLPPHLGQIHCNKEAVFHIVSSKTLLSATDSLSPAGKGSMKATVRSAAWRSWDVESLRSIIVCSRGSQTFPQPPKQHWLLASEPLCKTDNATIYGKKHLRSELIFNFSFFSYVYLVFNNCYIGLE